MELNDAIISVPHKYGKVFLRHTLAKKLWQRPDKIVNVNHHIKWDMHWCEIEVVNMDHFTPLGDQSWTDNKVRVAATT